MVGMVSNVLDAIQPQLITEIDSAINLYGKDADYTLMGTLNQYPTSWVAAEPFNTMFFEFDRLTFTFMQLGQMIRMIQGPVHGPLEEHYFLKELTEQMKITVQHRLDRKYPAIIEGAA